MWWVMRLKKEAKPDVELTGDLNLAAVQVAKLLTAYGNSDAY
jgi:hypothetical protein